MKLVVRNFLQFLVTLFIYKFKCSPQNSGRPNVVLTETSGGINFILNFSSTKEDGEKQILSPHLLRMKSTNI
jgi:hypothetical protein